MENNQAALNQENAPVIKEKKSSPIILIVLCIVLFLGLGALGYFFYDAKTAKDKIAATAELLEKDNIKLKAQIDSLLKVIEPIKIQNDSLNAQLETCRQELISLREQVGRRTYVVSGGGGGKSAFYKKQYEDIKAQYEDLRGQIDKLVADKQALEKDKEALTTELNSLKGKNSELETQNQELNNKVTLGSALSAFNIKAAGVDLKGGSKKEVVTEKAKKCERIIVSYKVGKNAIATPGMKTMYVRILVGGQCLASGMEETVTFNGEQLPFTLKQDFTYENSEVNMISKYNKKQEFKPGKYIIELYCDNAQLGTSTFTLK
ncbi:MAG: hypothetical protein V2A54_05610 [Bacteroidota bacterium]